MKQIHHLLLLFACLALNSCAIAGGIFKAGMYWGIFLVIGLIALIVYIIGKGRR